MLASISKKVDLLYYYLEELKIEYANKENMG